MPVQNRRDFLKTSLLGAAAILASPYLSTLPTALGKSRKEIVFKPFPHPWMPPIDFVYLTDENNDPFKSSVKITQDGILLPDDLNKKKFSVNTRWFVEGFGFVMLSADNAGNLFSLDDASGIRNLNYEFALSRVIRNRNVKKRYAQQGTKFSTEVDHLVDLSEQLLEDASKKNSNSEQSTELANKSLEYALWAGEKIELEKARYEIEKSKRSEQVYFGCETRQYIWAKSEELTKRFIELFNFATITHYVWDTWYELFEPREGYYNWGVKDDIANWLTEANIRIEGRPLFWFHPSVTPDWLKNKNFDQLKNYVEKHTKDLVAHYGDRVLEWEVINEYHDWANIFNHTPEQITEIVKLACDKTKDVNPKVVKILNNCAPWGEYVAKGRMARMDATRPLRTPYQYIKDLHDACVDYDVLGIQVYFPNRDLSDIARLIERFEKFGKPIYITEIGASAGVTNGAIATGEMTISNDPYDWHRRWDEELQADWLEQVYTLYYSRPSIKAINWYDFSDFRPFIKSGGLVREDASIKRSFTRLKEILQGWNRLPKI